MFQHMKNLTQHIQEKLQISRNKPNHTLFPKTKEELKEMINSEIEKNGNKCSLNHIDVSKITDMSELFKLSNFKGDISNWNVSNVKDMSWMFAHTYFNGDISGWDVSNVENMSYMFYHSSFTDENVDISGWDVSNVKNMSYMFNYNFNFDCDLSAWDVSNVTDMYHMFERCPLQNNPPKWYKK